MKTITSLQELADIIANKTNLLQEVTAANHAYFNAISNLIRDRYPEAVDDLVSLLEQEIEREERGARTIAILQAHISVLKHGAPPDLKVVPPWE
ncbi:MAG: hypothetical protein K8H74_18090 [Notoacmeibacter sp.]|nr:hypothetical protein [Notoacmeibacter sp.]